MMPKKLKNDEKEANFIVFTSFSILGQCINFILPLVIAKILSPEGFGSYSLSMMVIFFFTSMFIEASQTPFIVFSNKELNINQKINKAFSVQLIFLFTSIILFIILSFLFNDYISEFTNISKTQIMFLCLAYIGFGFSSFLKNLFLALNERIYNATYFITIGIINLVLLSIFYMMNNLNLNTIFLIYFISPIISIVFFIQKLEFKKLFPLYWNKELVKEMLDWTKWQMVGLTAVYFINWGDNLVLRYFVSIEEIGIYNLAYQIFKGLISLTFILNSYFLPFIVQNIGDDRKIKNYLYVKRTGIVSIGVIGIIFLFFMIPVAFNWIYGNVYNESINVLRILLIGDIIALYNIFYIPILNSLKRYRFTQTSNIVHISVNILLNIILIPIIGIYGAAVATVIAYFIKTLMLEAYIYKKINQYSIVSHLHK